MTPTNRLSIISLSAAVLTVISFCLGVIPIPMTAAVCYPAAVLLGITALVTGFRALGQIRAGGERGRGMALVAIWTGGLAILAVVCAVTVTVTAVYYGVDFLQKN
jgi:hypothetical protein